MSDWRRNFRFEIERAQAARDIGNEGMARVCARRAAGITAGEYLRQVGKRASSRSAYDNLQNLLALPGLAEEVREAAGHFLLKVDENHNLPAEADLIQDARWLVSQLFPETGPSSLL